MAVADASHAFPARLLVVADRDYVGDDERWLALLGEVASATIGRPVAIQVRAKSASRVESVALAARARDVVPRNVLLQLNGDTALAERLGYAGVHWPEANIPATRPPHPIAFRSAAAHSLDPARRARAAGADFAVFGAVFAPGSHPGEGMGLDALREVARDAGLPVIAIGGIQPEHVADCIEAGAAGVAVVSGILGAPNIEQAVSRYLEAIEQGINTRMERARS